MKNKPFENNKVYLWGYWISKEKNPSLFSSILFCSLPLPYFFLETTWKKHTSIKCMNFLNPSQRESTKKWKSENKLFEKNKRTFEDIVFQERRIFLYYFSFCFVLFCLLCYFEFERFFFCLFIKGNLV